MKPYVTSVSQSELATVARIVAEESGASRVILFGSRATGTATDESDWDFLAIVPQRRRDFWLTSRVQERLPAILKTLPLEIITMSEKEFETTRHLCGTLALPASRGRVLYERKR